MTDAEKEAERLARRERSAERRRERDAQMIIDRQRREIEDLTKDQRTIFVSQLTKKANERDLENFFGQISKVKNIIMLRDKMSGCHKGFAYVEMTDLESIPNCLLFNNVVPDFQKFPILVKASEAEKNFNAKKDPSSTTYDGTPLGLSDFSGPETRIYLGNIHVSIDENAIKLIVDQFGPTESVKLHRDNLGNSKGFAFVKFLRAESASLAMSSLGGMELAGRPLKVGPVIDSKSGVIAGGLVGGSAMQDASGNWKLDTDEGDGQGFQLNSSSRAMLMAKLGQSAGIQVPQLPAPMMNSFGALVMPLVQQQQVPPAPPMPPAPANNPVVVPPVGGVPSQCLLVCNMFDPATESEPEWDLDIREDVVEECARHGAEVEHCHVERNKPGGMVFVKLRSVEAASKTAARMNGRFFAGRMITVTYLEPTIYAEMAY